MTARGSRGTSQAGQPTWWASLVVRTAALPLPSEHRWRYRQEFLAELYGMTSVEQRHHVTGVLSRLVALRVALTEPEQLLAKEATMAKSWRCRLRLHHWQRLRNPQGGWYRECRDCGKQDDFMRRGSADTFGGGGRGGV
jgi:hypothetical protein